MSVSLLFHSEKVKDTFLQLLESVKNSNVINDSPGMSTLLGMRDLLNNNDVNETSVSTDPKLFMSYLNHRYPRDIPPVESPIIITSTNSVRFALLNIVEYLKHVKINSRTLKEEIMLHDLFENSKRLIICDPIFRGTFAVK